MKYYKEIDNALSRYEQYKPWKTKSMDWICNRIDWYWKWKKITHEQMTELTNRVCNFLEGN